MTLNDLKPGVVVKLRSGKNYLYINNAFVAKDSYVVQVDEKYTDNLKHCQFDDLDVIIVYNGKVSSLDELMIAPGMEVWRRSKPGPKWQHYVKIIDKDSGEVCKREILVLYHNVTEDVENILKNYCAEHDGNYYAVLESKCALEE